MNLLSQAQEKDLDTIWAILYEGEQPAPLQYYEKTGFMQIVDVQPLGWRVSRMRRNLSRDPEDENLNIYGPTRLVGKIGMSMEPGTHGPEGMVSRIIVTIITLAGFLVGSLIYVAFYTSGFTFFQKTVVVLVALIIAVTIVAVAWVTWAGRRGMIRGEWMPWNKG